MAGDRDSSQLQAIPKINPINFNTYVNEYWLEYFAEEISPETKALIVAELAAVVGGAFEINQQYKSPSELQVETIYENGEYPLLLTVKINNADCESVFIGQADSANDITIQGDTYHWNVSGDGVGKHCLTALIPPYKFFQIFYDGGTGDYGLENPSVLSYLGVRQVLNHIGSLDEPYNGTLTLNEETPDTEVLLSLNQGVTLTVTFYPDVGFHVSACLVNNVNKLGDIVDNVLTLTNPIFDQYVFATIEAD